MKRILILWIVTNKVTASQRRALSSRTKTHVIVAATERREVGEDHISRCGPGNQPTSWLISPL